MTYLLDKSTCVFFLRGKLNLEEIILLKHIDALYISEITVFELRYGAENSVDTAKSHKALDRFLNHFQIIPIIGCLSVYMAEKVRMRRNGKPVQDFDLLIGSTCNCQ